MFAAKHCPLGQASRLIVLFAVFSQNCFRAVWHDKGGFGLQFALAGIFFTPAPSLAAHPFRPWRLYSAGVCAVMDKRLDGRLGRLAVARKLQTMNRRTNETGA